VRGIVEVTNVDRPNRHTHDRDNLHHVITVSIIINSSSSPPPPAAAQIH